VRSGPPFLRGVVAAEITRVPRKLDPPVFPLHNGQVIPKTAYKY
jgi:hypothetical protein